MAEEAQQKEMVVETPKKVSMMARPYTSEERNKKDEEELEQLLKEQKGEVEEPEEVEEEPKGAEEKTFKKRYSDLRRHQQKQAEEFKAELEE